MSPQGCAREAVVVSVGRVPAEASCDNARVARRLAPALVEVVDKIHVNTRLDEQKVCLRERIAVADCLQTHRIVLRRWRVV